MFYAARSHTITYTMEFFYLSLKLEVEIVVGGLWGCHHRQSNPLDPARLTCIVVGDSRAIWLQAGQEVVGGHFDALCQRASIPEFEVECDAQVAADVKLRRDHLNLTAAICQEFGYTGGLVKTDGVINEHIFSWLCAFLAL